MGRFFQATAPEFVDDNMFKLPWEIMANTIMNKEKVVDADIGEAQELNESLKAQGLASDDPYIKQTIEAKRQEIDDIVSGIKNNVMDYGKFSGKTKGLSRAITDEWSTGGIGKVQANLKSYQDYSTKLDEALKKDPGKYSAQQIAGLKQEALGRFNAEGGTAYDMKTGSANTFNGVDALGLDPLTELLQKNVGAHIKANAGEKVIMDNNGQWRIKTKTGEEGVSIPRLDMAARAFLIANPDVLSAVQQRTDLSLEGFQDPNAYLNSNIDSFIKTNTYERKTKDIDEKTNQEYMFNLGVAEEKRKEAEDIITYHTTGQVTSSAGLSIEDFNANRVANGKAITESKDRAIQIFADIMGYTTDKNGNKIPVDTAEFKKKSPAVWNRIAKGDYSDIENEPEAISIINTHKQAKYNLAGQQAMSDQYKKESGKSSASDTQGFSAWLKSKGAISVDQTASWKDMGVTGKQITATNKRREEEQLYMTESFKLPLGSFVTIGGVKVDLGDKARTMNEIIDMGLVIPERIKVPKMGVKTPGIAERTDKKGKVIPAVPETYEIQYKLADGSGIIGFDMSKGVVPITSYNDEGKIELGGVINFKGKSYPTRSTDMQTQSMIDYNTFNAKVLKTRLQLQKWTNAENVVIPDTGGAIYHGADVIDERTGKPIYKKGTITIPLGDKKFKTFDTAKPEIMIEVSKWLYK